MSARTARFTEKPSYRIALLSLVSLTFLMLAAFSAAAAPKSELWARWQAHDRLSKLSIDHSPWTAFLSKYVRTDSMGVNIVAYGSVEKSDRLALDSYITMLTMAPIGTYARPEQLAYWINLYNALTVQLILRHYPVESIMDIKISPGWFSVGPWGKKLVRVEGVFLSLDDIEHRILRPIWKDPRIHYAVNCASIGCPNLQKRAFTGKNADKMMEAAARAYVNHSRGAEFLRGNLYVSSIYNWFVEDFGGNSRGVIAHLKQYADPKLKAALEMAEDISGNRYDWSLNEDRRQAVGALR